jgi:hypothetical protein
MYFIKKCNPIRLWKLKHLAKCLSILVLYSLVTVSPAQADVEALNGDALKKLAYQGTWKSKRFGLWKWNEDNTVCLRLIAKEDNCSDTGTWEIADNVLCYKLSWWGKSYGIQENCFTVTKLEGGRYESYHHTVVGSMFKNFEVLE